MNGSVHDHDYLKAGNPYTPSPELEELAASRPTLAIRKRLAENPATPTGILIEYLKDHEWEVRAALAENTAAPHWIRKQLAADESATVRFTLASDPHTPLFLLKRLAEDEHPYVAYQAQLTMDVLALELALAELEFVAELGENHKLGWLLVKSKWISQSQCDELLRMAKERELPLGQTLARGKALPVNLITRALLLQSKLRRKEITESDALAQLKKAETGVKLLVMI